MIIDEDYGPKSKFANATNMTPSAIVRYDASVLHLLPYCSQIPGRVTRYTE